MEKDLDRRKSLQQQRTKKVQTACDGGSHCPNCGAAITADARFCENCGAPQHSCHCINCGATIDQNTALCPACGHPATMQCTYCGATMNAGENFCPECGNPRSGITCPKCSTLNFRSFCRKCNTPLNPMALYAVKQAKADPRYRRACAIADEISQLEDEIARLEAQIAAAPLPQRNLDTHVEMSSETRRMMEEFERMSAMSAAPKPQPAKPAEAPGAPKKSAPQITLDHSTTVNAGSDVSRDDAPAPGFADPTAQLEKLKAEYQAKLADFQKEIDGMIPDPADPPEIQRNFACAHMIMTKSLVTRKQKVRTGWVCNKCHVFHPSPADCAVAQFGGKWVMEDRLVTTEAYCSSTINL